MLAKSANRRTCVYSFENHQTSSGRKSGGILKLANCVNHKANDSTYDILHIQIDTLFASSHCRDETKYFVSRQKSYGDMQKKHG